MECNVEYVGKRRDGALRYWCREHRLPATAPPYTSCAGRGALAPTVLDLNPELFPGGVALWGALPPILNTARAPVDTGVHVHARARVGHAKEIDNTFDEVHLRTGDNTTIVSGAAAASYNISVILGRQPVELACPRCHELHVDDDWFAVNLHRKHLCLNCGHDFIAKHATIGNPVVAAKRALQDTSINRAIDLPRRTLDITTSDYPGGLQIWGTHPAILWTAQRNEETGIHVHAFDRNGTLVIDDTFAAVTINSYPLDPHLVRTLMAQLALPHLQQRVVSLRCPHCAHPHCDTNEGAFTPHRVHNCSNCNREFEARGRTKKTIGNPLLETLHAIREGTPEAP